MLKLEDSIAMAMDCEDTAILPYLPYILMDFWELGSSADLIVSLVKENCSDYGRLEILDLGCGKGAVSIKLAEELKCSCHGIDAIEDFIREARVAAERYNLSSKCKFEWGDARIEIKNLGKYNIIILGSIGPVFGDYYETMMILKKHLCEDGIIILDDGYIGDNNSYKHPILGKRSEQMQQITDAGMKILREYVDLKDNKDDKYELEFNNIKKRCLELIEKFPDKKAIFEGYIKKQDEEYGHLKNEIVCSTLVIGHN